MLSLDNSFDGNGGQTTTGVTIPYATMQFQFLYPPKKPSYSVAGLPLPSAAGAGAEALAVNARRSGEAASAGTGCPVWCDSTNWRTNYDNSIAAA